MEYSVIIVAAGKGKRMNLGYNKMFLRFQNKELICHTIDIFYFDKECTQIILVTNEEDVDKMKEVLDLNNYKLNKIDIVHGGQERQDSVHKGLEKVTNKIVLIHDGARPFTPRSLVTKLVNQTYSCGCTILGVPVKDTIKVARQNTVNKTLDRNELIAVQTPQGCLTDLLKYAYKKARECNYLGTDDASLIEKFTNCAIKVIDGSYTNIKITTQDDIIVANEILNRGDLKDV